MFTYQPVGENAYGPSAVTFAVGADRRAASVTVENLDINGQGRFGRASGTDGVAGGGHRSGGGAP